MSQDGRGRIVDAIRGFLKRPQSSRRPPRGRPRPRPQGRIRPNTDVQGVTDWLDDVLEKHHGDEREEELMDRDP